MLPLGKIVDDKQTHDACTHGPLPTKAESVVIDDTYQWAVVNAVREYCQSGCCVFVLVQTARQSTHLQACCNDFVDEMTFVIDTHENDMRTT